MPPRPCLSVKSLVPFISLVLGDGPSYYPVLKVRKLKFKGWLVCCCLVAKLCLTVTPWTIAHQALLSIGFPRQEYWSGLLFPSPGDRPDPGI